MTSEHIIKISRAFIPPCSRLKTIGVLKLGLLLSDQTFKNLKLAAQL